MEIGHTRIFRGFVDDVDVAFQAACAGAALVQSLHSGSVQRFEKSGAHFATNVDIAVEKAILDMLRTARPDDAVHGEEFGETGPGDAERVWWVDPLCGTLNYAAGLPVYSINIALVRGGDVVAADNATHKLLLAGSAEQF